MNAITEVSESLSAESSLLPMDHSQPESLTDIYHPNCNIALWQRPLMAELEISAKYIANEFPSLQLSEAVTPSDAESVLNDKFGQDEKAKPVSRDIAVLVDMFCCLFDAKRAGLRLTVLEKAMCPKFHVDRVPVRLVTTYCGAATEWLANAGLDRSKLGAGGIGKSDEESGLMQSVDDIHKLSVGDVALLKGELWEGNEGTGLVHRSPNPKDSPARLLLTLDLIDN
ncbi:DUF1826 domain-containing protein [Vibrio sonorensis]|uniref:DUF1826 domain-containing protein n=1 Tax=Vibrio sonorensis TaxID=1004316 RepID=UPI0008D99E15|nr:DUF1826 domain-containing protein [Vibrio sonorensis]